MSRAWNDDYAANIDFTPARPNRAALKPPSQYAGDLSRGPLTSGDKSLLSRR
jgi:hypothetical protein